MSTQLGQIAKKAKLDRNAQFTSLAHLLTPAFLKETWRMMNRKAASGVDGESTEQFASEMEERVEEICRQLKAGMYRAPPVRPESCFGFSATLPSRPGEFHPEPLTDPDVILSHHPARATARRLPPSVENFKAPPVAGWLAPNVGDLPPSLHEHYTRFITSTGQSAPLRRIGTFSLAGSPLVLSPLASPARFSSSVREPK
jgi:hypothetical protein